MIRRVFALLALMASLTASSAFAQASKDPIADAMPAAAPLADNEGDPLYGYLACAFFAGVTLFAVCKSSRRS